MKSIVIYHTRFGNTERIAKSLQTGLKEAAPDIRDFVVCANARNVLADSLKQYDLICIGAPTEGFTASKPIKAFLVNLKGVDLSGKYGFAFDTKLNSRLSGSAAKFIEKELINQGFKIILPRESAMVNTIKERGAIAGAILNDGEQKRFEHIGHRLATISAQIQMQDQLTKKGMHLS